MASEIRFNGKLYRLTETIGTGLTSIVYKTADGEVIKRYNKGISITKLEREVYWLTRLKGTDLAPELLAVDRSLPAILMTHAGQPITRANAPDDWETQLASLTEQLKANKCLHNDLSEHEILVKDETLRLTDFGSAIESKQNGAFEAADFTKKTRYFLDDYIVNYIRFILFDPPSGSEPHCFVLWKADERDGVEKEIGRRFEIVRAMVYTPRLFVARGRERKTILDKFYCGRPGAHGDKGETPFIVYFVLDKKPRYETRTNPFRGTCDTVNVSVFDLKTNLRVGRTAFLHGSDSVQESYDNLEALTIYAQDIPRSYWLRWRPTFGSVSAFFEYLNELPELEYVVLRNFDGLINNKADRSSDIDILVNDFYLFKRFSGAIGYKHKRPRLGGPALEYGGYKVAAYVSIGGSEVSIDLRFLGDQYYCSAWERDILTNRVMLGNIFVPDAENMFYSLLYHALVHKRSVSDQYRRALGTMASELGLDGSLATSDEMLWAWLDAFMEEREYAYVRPKELSIRLSAGAKRRMGVNAADDISVAEHLLNKRRPLEARHLILGVLDDQRNDRVARKLLVAAERQFKGPGMFREFLKFMARKSIVRMLPVAIKQPIKKLVST